MNALTLIPSNAITCQNGEPQTDSLKVAEAFGKLHKDVLRKLESLDCSRDFTERNFAPSEYRDGTGRNLPMWKMTKDGFMFLVMGFTGKKAAAIKEAFINKFNELADQVTQQTLPSPVETSHRIKLTDLIHELAELRGVGAEQVRIHYRQLFNNPCWPEGDEFAKALARAKLKTDIETARHEGRDSVKSLRKLAKQEGYCLISESEQALMRHQLDEQMTVIDELEKMLVKCARTTKQLAERLG
ncbi:hypothetical protein EHW61_16480 [Salinivibrio sp. VYel6]|uniref:Rha family transcriptional regulator n=1 Tax=Salinivibrio sp. VYel6 TaxID=2490493 RepID=UPI00128BFEF0|nr:Rha family transcriptional regulator [Salinivibrio sp. VYel6]MPX98223.1 hypothetical protein [Salinivibrio sp. VYel6]